MRYLILVLAVLVCFSMTTAIPLASSAVHGQLVLAASSSGWGSDSIWRPTVVKIGSRFMMWYSGESNSIGNIGLASSTDGTNWTPYPDNPVITARSSTWDGGGIGYPMVVPVNNQYYVYFSAYPANSLNKNIGVAVLPASQYPIPEYPSMQFMLVGAVLATAGCLAFLNREARAKHRPRQQIT